ncbi:MAG: hypothetical protein FWG92_01500 [Leptospirales bacterium]|nr:hypothetical protein [Leptospirales bacterium]
MRIRIPRGISVLRDDVALILKKLSGLYNEKRSLLTKMANRCRLQPSLLNAEEFSAINESINENTHLMSLVDSLDFEISAASDELLRITGMDKKTLDVFLSENNDSETAALRANKNECAEALDTTFHLFNNFLTAAQIKAEEYLTDSQELERIMRIKKLL